MTPEFLLSAERHGNGGTVHRLPGKNNAAKYHNVGKTATGRRCRPAPGAVRPGNGRTPAAEAQKERDAPEKEASMDRRPP